MTAEGQGPARLYAGTSGFAYPQWKPAFYPAELPSRKFLEYYSRRLNSVEINYTFRRLASGSALESWVGATQPGFLFSVKAHQKITHVLRLKDAAQFTEVFLRSIDPLRATKRLGPILFQLPPALRRHAPLLADFLAPLPSDLRYVIEFRHGSWLSDAVYQLLEGGNVCLCLAESDRFEVPEVVTAGFVYARLRKPQYSAEDRKAIAARAGRLLADGKEVFLFFKHEDTPDGALYAEEILKAVGT